MSNLGGIKHDSGKAPYHLLSVCAMEEMLAILEFGQEKYSAHNWRKGFKWSRLIGAAARHLFAFMRGEDRDPETGRLHTAHLMCCAMFLTEHYLRKLGSDDRYVETEPNHKDQANELDIGIAPAHWDQSNSTDFSSSYSGSSKY